MEGLRKPKTGKSCGTCRGYGLRLSWPRVGDRRRAISVPSFWLQDKYNASQASNSHPSLFVNMHEWHVATYYNAVSSGNLRILKQRVLRTQIPKTISLSLVDENDSSLLHYYLQNAASFFLNPLGSLAHLLLHIGLTDSSPSSVAVLNGLLAISALHVSGEARAIRFKTKAITMTRTALSLESSNAVVIGNLASSMLLYLYETLHMSSPIAWSVYLSGVKHVLQCSVERSAFLGNYNVIFDWIIYHETMVQFGQLYWARDGMKPFCRRRISNLFRKRPRFGKSVEADVTGCDPNVLDAISKIFDLIMGEEGLPASWSVDLLELEGKLRMKLLDPLESTLERGTTPWMHAVTILHSVATLVWVNRSVRGYCGTEATHQALVTQGVKILGQLKTCDLPWPLFIIAGETRTDEQRRIILNIIHQTRESSRTEHMDMVEELIETVWIYDDLDPDGLLSYNDKLRSVIQGYAWMPPFV
ncbi:hypothetical protein FDECE_15534 [Fusarium decemcellulare]|nr:hypothetical protein FDECE_15534 [Fusarium decemcellulare]